MADRYFRASGATQDWNATNTAIWSATDGGATGASVPTASDNVFFTSLSRNSAYICRVTATANCLSLNIQNPSAGVVTMNCSSGINIYGDFTMASTALFAVNFGTIAMLKVSGIAVIDTNGVYIHPTFQMNKAGTIFQLASNLKGRSIQRFNGTFDPQTYKVTCTQNLYGLYNFYDLEFSDPYYATTTGEMTFNGSLTITNNFTVKGTASRRVRLSGAYPDVQLTITAANCVDFEYADLRLIKGAGTADWDLSGITGNSGDAGRCTDITFTPARTMYWYRNTGNWKDPTKWFSETNGGGTAGRQPLPQDNCIFDENSFSLASQSVSVDYQNICKDLDTRNVTNSPTITTSISISPYIFGSIWCGTLKGFFPTVGEVRILGDNNSEFLPPPYAISQITIVKPRYVTVTLMGNLTFVGSRGLFLYNGNFDANDFNIIGGPFTLGTSSTFAEIYMGNGTWYLRNSGYNIWDVQPNSRSTIYCEGSTIYIDGNVNSNTVFQGGGKVYNNLVINIRNANPYYTFSIGAHSNIFNSITIMPESRIGIVGSTTQTATNWNVMKGARLYRFSGTTPYILAKAGGGTVDMSYMNIAYMTGSPVSTFNAVNSTNVTGNTNIAFTKDDRDYQRFFQTI